MYRPRYLDNAVYIHLYRELMQTGAKGINARGRVESNIAIWYRTIQKIGPNRTGRFRLIYVSTYVRQI